MMYKTGGADSYLLSEALSKSASEPVTFAKLATDGSIDWYSHPGWGPILKALVEEARNNGIEPGWIYLMSAAVSAEEAWGPNKNADAFPWEEMKRKYKTFLDAKVRIEHRPGTEIGRVFAAYLDETTRKIYVLFGFDPSKAPPEAVRYIENGWAIGVSMGCEVAYDVCSICGNVARTPAEYCEHLKVRYRCAPGGPLADSLSEACRNIPPALRDPEAVTQRLKYFPEAATLAYMRNFDPKWVDLSIVANPAAPDATTLFLIDFDVDPPAIKALEYRFEQRSGKRYPTEVGK